MKSFSKNDQDSFCLRNMVLKNVVKLLVMLHKGWVWVMFSCYIFELLELSEREFI